MSRIVTFYSYKGGVGRSMALANVAVLLAQRGLRVMAVDWDLEAPGLERYFDYYEKSISRGGLLSFLTEQHARLAVHDAHPERYAEQLTSIQVGGAHPLKLLGSGRINHLEYARTLDQFSWAAFFERGGGDFLEQLRDRWKNDFDVVLIDSRTGMSDSGGICTIQMPDVLVAMFTANYQSVLGVRDVVASVRDGRQHLAYDRLALTVLPLVCRMPRSGDLEAEDVWLERFASELGACFGDWLPKDVAARTAFQWFAIPHASNYSLGERLVVAEDAEHSDDRALRTAYERIATLVASDFADVGELADDRTRGLDYSVAIDNDYEHDVYVSYASSGSVLASWVRRFVSLLQERLDADLGRRARVFFDPVRIAEDGPNAAADRARARSAVLLAFLTPEYFSSSTTLRELQDFEGRRPPPGDPPIVPVIVRGLDEVPDRLRVLPYVDATKVPFARAKLERALETAVARTSTALRSALEAAPPYHELQTAHNAPRATPGKPVLVLPANPTVTSQNDLVVEAREILMASPKGALRVSTSSSRSLSEMRAHVDETGPDVIHFVGKGSSDAIYVAGDDGLPKVVRGPELASVFRSAPTLRVVVLEGCYNDAQVRGFSPSVPAVIGVRASASVKAMRSFLVRFYQELGAGVDAQHAFAVSEQSVRALEPEGSESPFVMTVTARIAPITL